MFWLILVFLSLFSALFVLSPLWFPRQHSERPARAELNRLILREQLQNVPMVDEADAALRDEVLAQALDTGSEQRPDRGGKNSKAIPILAVFALLLVVALTYQQTGARSESELHQALQSTRSLALSAPERSERLRDLLARSEALADAGKPKAMAYRYLSAQIQTELERFAEAEQNYALLVQREPDNAELWAAYGQAAYLAAGRNMNATAESALARSLAINPHQSSALSLQGMHAFQQQRYAEADRLWTKLLSALPPEDAQYALIDSVRARARTLAQSAPQARPDTPAPAEQAAQAEGLPFDAGAASASGADVSAALTVQVRATVPETLSPASAVFIYARAAEGPRMPLAIARVQLRDLPVEVKLDDSQAMMPAMRLSMFDEVRILARISPSGSATPGPGDWQASSEVLRHKELEGPVQLHIDAPL